MGDDKSGSSGKVATKVDYGLLTAGRRIFEESLGVVPGETVAIIVDEERADIGHTFSDIVGELGAKAELIILESLGRRPLTFLPLPLLAKLRAAQASVLLIRADPEEAPLRKGIVEQVAPLKLRHAHMIGLSKRAIVSAFSADPQKVSNTARAIRQRMRPSSAIRARSRDGLDLEAKVRPETRWCEVVGVVRSGRWGNLPAGQLYAHTPDVNGTYVGVASHYSARSVPGLQVSLEIEAGVCRKVTCADTGHARMIERYLARTRDLNRVGQVVIGCNPGLVEPIGEDLHDACVPGLHLVFGWTNPTQTGATWVSEGLFMMHAKSCDVDIDGAPIIRGGRVIF